MRFQEIQERCWTGYQQQGMKKKGDRQVPNCVPVTEVEVGPEITANQLLYKAAAMAMRDAGREGITLDYEDAIQQASKIYGIPYQPSELPKLMAQLKDIDQRLQALRDQKAAGKQMRQQQKYGTPATDPASAAKIAPRLDRIKPATKTLEEATDPFLDNAARELLALAFMVGVPFAIAAYQRVRNSLDRYRGQQIIQALIKRGVKMDRETYLETRPILDQFEDAVEANDGARASALAKRIEQMIVMGKLRQKEPTAADDALAAKTRELEENLKQWFKQKWVRFGPDGKIRGPCARGSSKEGKPKCLPQAKAQALGKKGRASAAAKKRREDPDPERRGPAKNVATKVKEAASPAQQAAIAIAMKRAGKKPNAVDEGVPFDQCPACGGPIVHISLLSEKQDACYHKVKSRYKVWPSAYASGALVQCRKKGAANWGTGGKKK